MKRSDLPVVTIDLRRAGELLAHPCICGHTNCTLGDHLWRSTADMAPGIRAQSTDPRARSWPTDTGPDAPTFDPTESLHLEYRRLVQDAQIAARAVANFVERYRPERAVPLSSLVSVGLQWCPNHLRYTGLCEPIAEGRDGLCRWCWDIRQAEGALPDAQLMRERHQRGRITPTMIEDFRTRVKASRNPKRTRSKAG